MGEDRHPRDSERLEVSFGLMLHRSLGGSRKAVKTVMRWSGAGDRTVKNWFAGKMLPSSSHLIGIIRHSDDVLAWLLAAASPIPGAVPVPAAQRLHQESRISGAAFDGLRKGRSLPSALVPDQAGGTDHSDITDGTMSDRRRLTSRQRWFVTELHGARRPTATALAQHWSVSVRTARRDIAALKKAGFVRFVGSRSHGLYLL